MTTAKWLCRWCILPVTMMPFFYCDSKWQSTPMKTKHLPTLSLSCRFFFSVCFEKITHLDTIIPLFDCMYVYVCVRVWLCVEQPLIPICMAYRQQCNVFTTFAQPTHICMSCNNNNNNIAMWNKTHDGVQTSTKITKTTMTTAMNFYNVASIVYIVYFLFIWFTHVFRSHYCL